MNSSEVYESNLQHFTISKRYGDKAQARCPAHDDKQASLTISRGRKCTLFFCHAGCSLGDILSTAGLDKKDTFYDTEPQKANLRAYIESREQKKIEAIYHYVSCNGSNISSKNEYDDLILTSEQEERLEEAGIAVQKNDKAR